MQEQANGYSALLSLVAFLASVVLFVQTFVKIYYP
jgi:hypothetical protein